VHDDADEPRYFIAVAEDIGKRNQAEEEPQRTQEQLRQSEERFKVLAQEEYEAQRTIGNLTPREKQVLSSPSPRASTARTSRRSCTSP
jgi:hypothetical protein